jgi:hypothetical protein
MLGRAIAKDGPRQTGAGRKGIRHASLTDLDLNLNAIRSRMSNASAARDLPAACTRTPDLRPQQVLPSVLGRAGTSVAAPAGGTKK